MMQRFLMSRRTMLYSLAGMLMTAMMALYGCGGSGSTGSGSYPDPTPTTTKSAAVIDASTLMAWINEGKLNAPMAAKASVDGAAVKSSAILDRVVVVSPSTTTDWTTKGHIPGAVRWGTDETAMSRVEGLALAANMMPNGPMMDGIIQRLGIDGNTTIVISLPKNSSLYGQSLIYWDLRYWGFPRERVKILNGGDDAWEAAGYALSTDATEKYTASTYSVKNNAALNESFRYSIGDMITKTNAIIDNAALKDEWQLLEVRGATTTPYITNALRQPSAVMFLTRLNGDATKNYVYPDKATLISRMATLPVKDGTTDVYVSPTKKTIAMCGYSTSASPSFVLFDAILEVPAGNIALYDGSAGQWNNYSTGYLSAKYTTATPTQISLWSFNDPAITRSQLAAGTTWPIGTKDAKGNDITISIWTADSPALSPSHPDMNQILKEDKAYMTPTGSSTTGGTTGGGSAPSGC